jgi:hypothetical protein
VRAYDRRVSPRYTALRLMTLAIPVMALFCVMQSMVGSIGSEGTTWHFDLKPLWLFRIMNGYNLTVEAAPMLAVHYANAFVPNLFTEVGKQPAGAGERSRPPSRHPHGGPTPIRVLAAIAAGQTSSDIPPFIRTRYRDDDYLYVRVSGPVPLLAISSLRRCSACGAPFTLSAARPAKLPENKPSSTVTARPP